LKLNQAKPGRNRSNVAPVAAPDRLSTRPPRWRQSQISSLSEVVAGDADRAEQRCFAPALLNATKFRVRGKKRRTAQIRLKAAGSPDDSDRINSLQRNF
jgi:hypothetical protein